VRGLEKREPLNCMLFIAPLNERGGMEDFYRGLSKRKIDPGKFSFSFFLPSRDSKDGAIGKEDSLRKIG
jgi:hypothetical protein